ncbi:MAG: hypothetical protein R3C68_15985 [Myxococcota bacterium]
MLLAGFALLLPAFAAAQNTAGAPPPKAVDASKENKKGLEDGPENVAPLPEQPTDESGVNVEASPPPSTKTAPRSADTPPASPSASSAPTPEASDYNLKLRSIEERVNSLKEKIFQSKARLIQLQEMVLHGSISGSKAVLIHRNEMGSSFRAQSRAVCSRWCVNF